MNRASPQSAGLALDPYELAVQVQHEVVAMIEATGDQYANPATQELSSDHGLCTQTHIHAVMTGYPLTKPLDDLGVPHNMDFMLWTRQKAGAPESARFGGKVAA